MKQKEYYQFLQLAIPLFSYLALVQIWEQYNYIQMRNYYTLVHIMRLLVNKFCRLSLQTTIKLWRDIRRFWYRCGSYLLYQ